MAVCDLDHVGGKFILSLGRHLWHSALNFVYPPVCLVCKEALSSKPGLCHSCRNDLVVWQRDVRRVNFREKFEEIFVLYDFNDCVRRLVHLLKYRDNTLPGRILGHALGQHIAQEVDSDWIIVPVPLHPAKKRARGYNQSEVIANAAGQVLGCSVIARSVCRVKPTITQTQLGVAERRDNVHGAFQVRKAEAIRGQNILLVDDVVTTGATLEACMLALKDSGAKRIIAGAIACPQLENGAIKPIDVSQT